MLDVARGAPEASRGVPEASRRRPKGSKATMHTCDQPLRPLRPLSPSASQTFQSDNATLQRLSSSRRSKRSTTSSSNITNAMSLHTCDQPAAFPGLVQLSSNPDPLQVAPGESNPSHPLTTRRQGHGMQQESEQETCSIENMTSKMKTTRY